MLGDVRMREHSEPHATVILPKEELDRLRAIESAATNLVNVKGRFNSKLAMDQLTEVVRRKA